MMKVEQSQYNEKDYKRIFNISVVLSFVVATFAIVSLIAVGFNQVSYAADDEETEIIHSTVGTTFYIVHADEEILENGKTKITTGFPDNVDFKEYSYYNLKYQGTNYRNAFFMQEDTQYVSTNEDNTTTSYHLSNYKEIEILEDSGCLHIYNMINNNNNSISEIAGENGDVGRLKSAALQLAFSMYYNTISEEQQNFFGDINHKYVYYFWENNDDDYVLMGKEVEQKILYNNIKKIVETAKSIKDSPMLLLSNDNNEITESQIDNYYETSIFYITAPIDNYYEKYNLNIDGIDNITVVDKDGNIIDDISNIDSSITSFKILIPKEIEKSDIKNLKVTVQGQPSYTLSKYTDEYGLSIVSPSYSIQNHIIASNTISYETL